MILRCPIFARWVLCAFVFGPVSREAAGQAGPPAPPPAPVSTAVEQKANVRIKVQAKGSGLPLSKVELKHGRGLQTTDPQGETQLFIPPSGDGKVVLTRSGYEPLEVPYSELRPAGEYDIFLYPGTPDDEVIVVTGRKRAQVSRKSVSIEESRRIAPGGDPAQVIKLLPGVQTQAFGSQVIVRGSGPRDSRYYIDDLEVPFIFHGIGDLSVVAAPLMEEVEFDSGGFSPAYGNATGGVITIRTKTDIPERPATEFVVNLPFYSGLTHSRPLSESSALTVSLRRSYVDVIIRQVLQSREDEAGGQLMVVPYFGDAHIVHLSKQESGHTRLSLLGAYDGIKAAIPTDSFADEDGRAKVAFETSFVNIGVEAMRRLNREWRYTTTPQVYYLKTNAGFFGNELGLQTQKFRMPTEVSRRLSKSEQWSFGVDPAYQSRSTSLNAIDYRPGDPTFDPEDAPRRKLESKGHSYSLAAWTLIDQQLGEALIASPGLRAAYHRELKKTAVDPRLQLRYLLSEQQTIKGAIGQYSQAPSSGQSSREFGNPDLTFIRSMHYVLGLETKWNEAWTSEVQAYYKTAADNITGNPALRYDNDGSFRSWGVELFVRRSLTARLFGWLSYTYSKTEERDSDTEAFRDSEYDQTHVLNVVGSYRLTAQWDLGLRYNHHTGDTYSPVHDAVYNVNLDKYQARQDPRAESSARLPGYNALTVYLTREFLFDTWKLALKWGLESFWSKPQVVGMGYNYDYSKKQEAKGLTAIPFLELRGEL